MSTNTNDLQIAELKREVERLSALLREHQNALSAIDHQAAMAIDSLTYIRRLCSPAGPSNAGVSSSTTSGAAGQGQRTSQEIKEKDEVHVSAPRHPSIEARRSIVLSVTDAANITATMRDVAAKHQQGQQAQPQQQQPQLQATEVKPRVHSRKGGRKQSGVDEHPADSGRLQTAKIAMTAPVHDVHVYNNLVGSGEDRVISLRDLGKYILEFKEKGLDSRCNAKYAPDDKLLERARANAVQAVGTTFVALFDGHMGRITAELAQALLPFYFVATKEFGIGDYENAFKVAIPELHAYIRDSPHYHQEKLEVSNTSSGATCAAAFTSPTTTYFAALGDSPIIYHRSLEALSRIPHMQPMTMLPLDTWWHEVHRKRLLSSRYPLIVNECEFMLYTAAATKDFTGVALRPGFTGLEPAGALGDTIYDAEVFNVLVDLLEQYKRERLLNDVAQVKTALNIQSEAMGQDLVRQIVLGDASWEALYSLFKVYIESESLYVERLRKHLRLNDNATSDMQQQQFFQFILCISTKQADKQRLPPGELVRRTPGTASVPNSELLFYALMSDGIMDETTDLRRVRDAVMSGLGTEKDKQRGFAPEALTGVQQQVVAHLTKNPRDPLDDQSLIFVGLQH